MPTSGKVSGSSYMNAGPGSFGASSRGKWSSMLIPPFRKPMRPQHPPQTQGNAQGSGSRVNCQPLQPSHAPLPPQRHVLIPTDVDFLATVALQQAMMPLASTDTKQESDEVTATVGVTPAPSLVQATASGIIPHPATLEYMQTHAVPKLRREYR